MQTIPRERVVVTTTNGKTFCVLRCSADCTHDLANYYHPEIRANGLIYKVDVATCQFKIRRRWWIEDFVEIIRKATGLAFITGNTLRAFLKSRFYPEPWTSSPIQPVCDGVRRPQWFCLRDLAKAKLQKNHCLACRKLTHNRPLPRTVFFKGNEFTVCSAECACLADKIKIQIYMHEMEVEVCQRNELRKVRKCKKQLTELRKSLKGGNLEALQSLRQECEQATSSPP